MGFLFSSGIFEILFLVVFIIVVGTFIVMAIKNISTWNKNNNSPRLTVQADVVAKRVSVSHHTDAGDINGFHGSHTHTSYYVTFQVASGDRIEFSLSGREYGMIVEGDRGMLTFQGTRYLSFERL